MREFDEFVKMAATRWKKEMGNLSEESREILRNKVAKPPEEIVKGIERGNLNLIDDLGVIVTNNRRHVKNALKDNTPFSRKDRNLAAGIIMVSDPVTYTAAKLDGLQDNTSNKHGIIAGFKKVSDPDTRYKIKNYRPLKRIYPNASSDFEQRAADAIMLRHELDENRDSMQYGAGHKYGTHNSPGVIHRESANLALMPKEVRDAFTKIRQQGIEEADMGEHGVEYGKSPYYDKAKSKTHVANYRNKKNTGRA